MISDSLIVIKKINNYLFSYINPCKAQKGFKSLVQSLVSEHGALLDAMTLTKQTSLHLAAESGKL